VTARPILTGVNRVDARQGDGPDPAPDATATVALPLHGVAHTDDLAVQAFARHLAAAAGPAGRTIIAGMRAFLEGRPELLPDPPWSEPPPSGYRAVELLAAAAGCGDAEIARARWASRRDLAASAWILDPADGVEDLLCMLAGTARAVVVAEPDDPATRPVLDALNLTGRVTLAGEAELPALLAGGDALLIDTSWVPRLAAAHAAGHSTALIDRFGTNEATCGEPDLTARDLAGLRPGVAAWLATPPIARGARP
jgi:hypothetical protein